MSKRVTLWRAQIAGNSDGSRRGLAESSGPSVRESPAETAARVKANGLPDRAGPEWRFADLLERRNQLRDNPKLFSDPSVGRVRGFFATADRDTAHWYGSRYGLDDTVVVEFEAPEEALIVDCRDFLDRVFIFADRLVQKDEHQKLGPMRECIRRYWGDRVLDYFDALGSGGKVIDLVNAAAYDLRVVRAHVANSVVLQGRSGVVFRNQLAVLAPVSPKSIRSVEQTVAVTLSPAEHLASLIFG